MTTPAPFLSNSLVFEQMLLGLASCSRSDALAEINPILERFVLELDPGDERKAERFVAMTSCEHFDANHRIVCTVMAPLAGAGLPDPVQRPMEFAICQFLSSGGSLAWRRAIMRLAAHPRFDGALQRPLLFTKIMLIDGPDLAVHHQHVAAFAHTFLLQEAEALAFEPEAAHAARELALALEMRMEPEAREAARQEHFMIQSFGKIMNDPCEKIRARLRAIAPIQIRSGSL